jgi:hypothetical protein
MDNNIISLIKQTKWKSFEKLYSIIKEKYPKITSKHLKYLIDNNITHDIKSPVKDNSKYLIKSLVIIDIHIKWISL